MTDDVNCLVITIVKDDNNIGAEELIIKLFNFYHRPTQLSDLINSYTDFTVSYRDALNRLRVPWNNISIAFTIIFATGALNVFYAP